MLWRKWRGDILSSLPGLHNTIPSGMNTGRLARSSETCAGEGAWGTTCATSGSGHKDITKPQHCTANAGQHSGYSNSSIHTLYTAGILQPANNCHKEEARATTLCMAWHAQQEVSSCATIPTDTGRRGHPATTTSVAAGGEAMRVQDKQGQTAKERYGLTKHKPQLRSMAPIC